ncbi:MAG: Wzz/FepE/Etk N-terminal domain-containing protein [Acidobacteriota bacterium]|nr:Wzz/FepE/Etk N-terminal domain-containing protein [Acidobacteriota bacterium]
MSVEFRQRKPGELARMIWRRKWLIVLPTVAVAVGVGVGVWKLPNVYESTTLLTVRPASISTSVVPQLSDSELTIRINNITQEVTSRSTLEPMIERYGLYARERQRGASMDELVEQMRTKDIKINLNTSRNEITNGFFLSFRGAEPRSVQGVTEELARKYVDAQRQGAGQDATLTKEFFTEKLNQAKEQLDEIDKRRLDFMQGHIQSLPSSSQALVGQLAGLREEQKARIAEIGRLNDQISANNKFIADLAKSNQQQVDEFVANMQDPKSTAAYAELVKRKAELETAKQALLKQFRPKHPDVVSVQSQLDSIQGQMTEMEDEHKRKVEEVRKRLTERVDPRLTSYKGINAQLQGDVQRQQSLLSQTEAQIAAVTQQIGGVPTSEVGLEALNREYESAKAVYDQMVEQQKKAEINADVAGRAQGESIAVIDPASLPEQPVAPKRPLLMLLGLFAGLACGITLAAAVELPRLLTIQTTEDAEHYTGLPVLVALPVLRTAGEERSLRARRLALAAASVAATILSAPALYFVLSRLHLIEMFANRG